jgi:hypothetical protein
MRHRRQRDRKGGNHDRWVGGDEAFRAFTERWMRAKSMPRRAERLWLCLQRGGNYLLGLDGSILVEAGLLTTGRSGRLLQLSYD